jgi:hypothetical protein
MFHVKHGGSCPQSTNLTIGAFIMIGASYKTKKALKEAIGQPLHYVETSMFGPEYKPDGKFCVVGPSPYERKWYAEVTMKDGKIYSVK